MQHISNYLMTCDGNRLLSCAESPFFIVASPRSGTTLLERLLNRHTDIFIPPETAFFSLFKQFGFLNRTFNQQTAKRAVDFYLTKRPASLLKLNEIENVREKMLQDVSSYPDIFVNLLGILSDGISYSVVGEKTPHHLRCVDYILKSYPRSCIVAVIRDGRAVVNSHVKHPNWGNNYFVAASAWRNDTLMLSHLLSSADRSRVHLVRYENLLDEPEAELIRVCEFLGLEYQKKILYGSSEMPERFEEYYQQTWMAKSVDNIDPTRKDSWKAEYRQHELAMVEHIIGKELQKFGYDIDVGQGTGWQLFWLKEWMRFIWHRTRLRLVNRRANAMRD